MNYPFITQKKALEPYPIFGDQFAEHPLFLDMSEHNPDLENLEVTDQKAFAEYINSQMQPDYKWAVSDYLEYRSSLLGHLPQMSQNKRFFSFGLRYYCSSWNVVVCAVRGYCG